MGPTGSVLSLPRKTGAGLTTDGGGGGTAAGLGVAGGGDETAGAAAGVCPPPATKARISSFSTRPSLPDP